VLHLPATAELSGAVNERRFDDLDLREEAPRSPDEPETGRYSDVRCTQYTFGCVPGFLTGGCCV
jgi:hypothetical protein